jgi:hypothetical protein
LYLTIIGPPWARRLSEGMQHPTLHHNEMVWELVVFLVAVSTATELVLGRSPNNIARVEVVGELVAELYRVQGHRSKLDRPATKI